MGMDALRELAPFVKEALQKTATLAKTFCFLHVINNYLCNVGLLVGPSMLPAFNHGNLVLAESITRRFGKVGSGDVVFIRSPVEPRKIITKRVKGVEGDIVSYVVDPNKSDEQKSVVLYLRNIGANDSREVVFQCFRYRRDMFGSKGIIHSTVRIPESLVLFLTRI